MWVATSFGFLMPAVRPPKMVPFGDARTLQVRARRAKDLDILRAEYMKGQLGPTMHTPDKDYEYRAYCVPADFALAMARMVTEIDYTKFKPTTLDQYEDDELHSTYNAIWSVLLNRLSTKAHQWSYWSKNAQPADKGSGTGFPKAVAGGAGYVVGPEVESFLDPERERLDEWLERRSTAVDRDSYEPDVAWDDDDVAVVSTGRAEVDSLYAEIDTILEELKSDEPLDHATCQHPATRREEAKCRAAHRQAEQGRIEEIRRLIDESYADFKADSGAEAESTN